MVRVVNVTNSRGRTRFKLWPTEHYQYVPKELMHHRMPSKESKIWQVKILLHSFPNIFKICEMVKKMTTWKAILKLLNTLRLSGLRA